MERGAKPSKAKAPATYRTRKGSGLQLTIVSRHQIREVKPGTSKPSVALKRQST